MRTTALALSILLVSASLFAQENKSEGKFKYSNITEFGFITVNPQSFAFEGTTVQGFSINKKHHLGLGIGMGVNLEYGYYMPVFANYRLYFHPERTFSPHVNYALGGIIMEESGGIYNTLTAGFKAGAFSFDSGLSWMMVTRRERGYVPAYGYYVNDWHAYFPFGFVLKFGFSF
ncbi:MAG: hypothetical protein FWH36_01875 [Lentimicrobiaceae bacterium]|nr:hypothetical protein [Lentimicrobiaceae bacterium]